MIKIEHTEVFGWEASIRGLRNPKNSWDKSDSRWTNGYISDNHVAVQCGGQDLEFQIGPNDLKLMKTLSKAGNDHGKFLRMINVTCDITAPLYWWKEFDTYKIGTVANSCSTMHKIAAKPFELDDFSHEHLYNTEPLEYIIKCLNQQRYFYLDEKNKAHWWQMIQLLPTSYNQKRTVQFNYQVLKSMYFARKDHKLDEWHTLCDWTLTLPMFNEICVED